MTGETKKHLWGIKLSLNFSAVKHDCEEVHEQVELHCFAEQMMKDG
jgi:hypothetical protein